MAGESNLVKLIRGMKPELHEGEYVFVSFPANEEIPDLPVIASMQEAEGVTLVLEKEKAEELSLSFDFVCSWITLQIHSSLEAVGLTATFSGELARHQISCNVISGYYHDHIFVGVDDKERAVTVLEGLAANYAG